MSLGMAAVPAQAGDVSTVISPLLTGYSTTHACARHSTARHADVRLNALEASLLSTTCRERGMHRTNEDRADLQVGGKRIWQNLGMMTTESSNEEGGLNR